MPGCNAHIPRCSRPAESAVISIRNFIDINSLRDKYVTSTLDISSSAGDGSLCVIVQGSTAPTNEATPRMTPRPSSREAIGEASRNAATISTKSGFIVSDADFFRNTTRGRASEASSTMIPSWAFKGLAFFCFLVLSSDSESEDSESGDEAASILIRSMDSWSAMMTSRALHCAAICMRIPVDAVSEDGTRRGIQLNGSYGASFK
jgi:hypothetical protein